MKSAFYLVFFVVWLRFFPEIFSTKLILQFEAHFPFTSERESKVAINMTSTKNMQPWDSC